MKDFEILDARKRTFTGKKFELKHTFLENEIFILFIGTGKCKAVLNDMPYTLSPGEFLISIGKAHLSYCFSDSLDAILYCVHASFSEKTFSQDVFYLSSGVYPTLDTRSVKIAFTRIFKEYSLRSSFSSIRLSSFFTELLCTLSESRSEHSKAVKEAVRLADDINKDFISEFDVSTYSDKVGLSKDRFSVIFRERYGYAPYKYQLMLKINEATYLLRHTDLPIRKISEMLGFSNQLYFSSAYKAQTGYSPTQARKGV